MKGIFSSIDLKITGEESGHRTECRTSNIVVNTDAPTGIWFIPFESDGYTVIDTYTFALDFVGTDADQYAYKVAVYRQHSKLSDTATTIGVGKIVPGSTHSSGILTGNRKVRNTSTMGTPFTLRQGSYFIAMHIYMITAKPAGPLVVTSKDGINAGMTAPWCNQSHMYGVATNPGTLPTDMTTSDANLTSLAGTFASGIDSFWAGAFFNGDAYP